MKKLNRLLGGVALGAMVAFLPSVGKATIVNSAHDFYSVSNSWYNGTKGVPMYTTGKSGPSVCSECHQIHHAPNPANGPLWIHAPSTVLSYKTYEQAGSETFDALNLTVKLGPSSIACLSCHDGTVGINETSKLGMDGTATAIDGVTTNGTGGVLGVVTLHNIGDADKHIIAVNNNDLTHTHPIGISYDDAVSALNALNPGTAELNPKSGTFLTSTLPIKSQLKGLSQSQMECSTCHDIHGTRNIPHGQNLCLSCHNK